jgi:nitrous oxidase accessory protein NosD
MSLIKGAAATLAVTAGALSLVSPAAAKTRHVHKGQSIQAAIDKSKPGDKVVVDKGTYAESLQISTNNIQLVGNKVTLTQPATTPPPTLCNQASDNPSNVIGICVHGDATIPAEGAPTVTKYVKGVEISGFTVKKFSGDGIFVFAAKGTVVKHDSLRSNGGYGSFANTSSGTKYLHNVSKNNADAGFYVGDSPHAKATVEHNRSIGNKYGLLLRDAEHGTVADNTLDGNCAGVLVLADNPGPSGNWTIQKNTANGNNKACAAQGPEPAISGIGIALSGANDTKVLNNKVQRNKNLHASAVGSGGILVQKGTGGTVPKNDLVKKNKLSKNSPFDIDWDSTGTVTFKQNTCTTSSPSGLCA